MPCPLSRRDYKYRYVCDNWQLRRFSTFAVVFVNRFSRRVGIAFALRVRMLNSRPDIYYLSICCFMAWHHLSCRWFFWFLHLLFCIVLMATISEICRNFWWYGFDTGACDCWDAAFLNVCINLNRNSEVFFSNPPHILSKDESIVVSSTLSFLRTKEFVQYNHSNGLRKLLYKKAKLCSSLKVSL